METTFAFLFALSFLACIIILIIFVREKRKVEELQSDISELTASITPFKHWEKFTDNSYSIPLNCKLYQKSGNGFVSIGTVADHFEDFFELSCEEVLEDYFYGDVTQRVDLPIKFLSANSRNNEILISSSYGKEFWIMRNDHVDFPDYIKIQFENMYSKEVVDSEVSD